MSGRRETMFGRLAGRSQEISEISRQTVETVTYKGVPDGVRHPFRKPPPDDPSPHRAES